MTVYADTSVIAAVVFEEPSSEAARGWFRRTSQRIIVSDLARLEFAAVVSRGVRTGRFDDGQAARALASFDEFFARRLSSRRRAESVGRETHRDYSTKLAAPDALHLASARNAGAALATFDVRLAEAARAQGVEVALG